MVPEVDVEPGNVYLYDVKHGQPKPTTVKILGKPGKPLNILSAQSANGVVTVTGITPVKDDPDHRNGAILQIDVPTTLPIGTISDSISVKTDNKKKPDVSIQVMGEVVGSVKWNPKTLYFSPNQTTPVTIIFTPENPAKFSIRKVESLKHLVRPSVIQSVSGNVNQYSLAASVIKNIPKDSDGKDQIIVYTNDDDIYSKDSEKGKITIDVQASK
jgi:hypothetical protein